MALPILPILQKISPYSGIGIVNTTILQKPCFFASKVLVAPPIPHVLHLYYYFVIWSVGNMENYPTFIIKNQIFGLYGIGCAANTNNLTKKLIFSSHLRHWQHRNTCSPTKNFVLISISKVLLALSIPQPLPKLFFVFPPPGYWRDHHYPMSYV